MQIQFSGERADYFISDNDTISYLTEWKIGFSLIGQALQVADRTARPLAIDQELVKI